MAAGLGSSISTRRRRLILGLVVLCGAAARALPLLVANGPQATSTFDEGIYLSAYPRGVDGATGGPRPLHG